MGKLADRFGPKKVFTAGLVLVGIAGVVPEVLTGFGGAVFARVLIGIGTSSAYPAALTTLRQHSLRIGKPTPPLVLGGAVDHVARVRRRRAPLGGALIAAFGWHAIFLVNVPLAVFGLVVATLVAVRPAAPACRRGRPGADRARPARHGAHDRHGVGAAVFLLDLGAGLWWLLAVAVVLLVALVLWELRATKPFVDVRLLVRNGALSRTYARLFLTYLLAYTMTYGFSQWVQDVAGYPSDVAGTCSCRPAVVAGVVSFLVARRTAVRRPLVVAALVPLVGSGLLLLLHAGSPLVLLLVVPALFGVPQALASVSNQAALYRVVPSEYIGTAAGLSRTSIYIGAIAASSLIGGVFGQAPTTPDLHVLAWVMLGVGVLLSVLTLGRTGWRGRTGADMGSQCSALIAASISSAQPVSLRATPANSAESRRTHAHAANRSSAPVGAPPRRAADRSRRRVPTHRRELGIREPPALPDRVDVEEVTRFRARETRPRPCWTPRRTRRAPCRVRARRAAVRASPSRGRPRPPRLRMRPGVVRRARSV